LKMPCTAALGQIRVSEVIGFAFEKNLFTPYEGATVGALLLLSGAQLAEFGYSDVTRIVVLAAAVERLIPIYQQFQLTEKRIHFEEHASKAIGFLQQGQPHEAAIELNCYQSTEGPTAFNIMVVSDIQNALEEVDPRHELTELRSAVDDAWT